MSTEARMIEGRDWDYTPAVVPSCHAQFLSLTSKPGTQANQDQGT
jgi:hypothetical protein